MTDETMTAALREWQRRLLRGLMPAWQVREMWGIPVPADPNPFPRFRLFRWLP